MLWVVRAGPGVGDVRQRTVRPFLFLPNVR